jgi:hypothetical protein
MNRLNKARITATGFAVAGLAGAGLLTAAPAHSAPGEFIYTPALTGNQRAQGIKPEQKTVMNPKANVCIKTDNGTKAKNYTLGKIQLYSDNACHLASILLNPGETNGAPFNSIKALK